MLYSTKDIHDFFTKQTIFAYLAKQSLSIIWMDDVIKNAMDDRQKINLKYH